MTLLCALPVDMAAPAGRMESPCRENRLGSKIPLSIFTSNARSRRNALLRKCGAPCSRVSKKHSAVALLPFSLQGTRLWDICVRCLLSFLFLNASTPARYGCCGRSPVSTGLFLPFDCNKGETA